MGLASRTPECRLGSLEACRGLGSSPPRARTWASLPFPTSRHVKVSLFLQDGIQKNDGTIALSCAGALPPAVEVPGKIIYFDHSGSSIGVDSFVFPGVDSIDPTPAGELVQRAGLCSAASAAWRLAAFCCAPLGWHPR